MFRPGTWFGASGKGTGGGAVTTLVASLAADQTFSADTAYHDVTGCAIVLPAGTWDVFVTMTVTCPNTAGLGAAMYGRLLAGATAIGTCGPMASPGGSLTESLQGAIIAGNVAGGQTVKLQARTTGPTDLNVVNAIADAQGAGANTTRIMAIKVG